MAGLTVGEALTNLVWANITKLEDVKCSGNWMWAAKLKVRIGERTTRGEERIG
jgi:phosphoribosylformylglycinamidine synthase